MSLLTTKSYSELITFPTFLERYNYLRIGGYVGKTTFGGNRFLNQRFYKSPEWLSLRRQIILRDKGFDLGMKDYHIIGKILIHHIVPITEEDILDRRECLFDPENLICVSHMTHEAIHFGYENILPEEPIERRPNDTIPWR